MYLIREAACLKTSSDTPNWSGKKNKQTNIIGRSGTVVDTYFCQLRGVVRYGLKLGQETLDGFESLTDRKER